MADDAQDAQRKILFHGEMQLAAWGESMQAGAWVKMWVHPEDLESFKHMKARTGKHAGQRLGVVMVQIGDDEAIVEHEGQAPASTPAPTPAPAPALATGPTAAARASFTPHIGECGMIAVRWCRDTDFQRWATFEWHNTYGHEVTSMLSSEGAKAFILDVCGVTEAYGTLASRKHLDIDEECTRAFHERIRIPFRDWLKEQGIQK